MTKTCETCRWWQKWLGTVAQPDIGGACKRFPPMIVQPLSRAPAFQPATRSTDWCGEHQPKEVTP